MLANTLKLRPFDIHEQEEKFLDILSIVAIRGKF